MGYFAPDIRVRLGGLCRYVLHLLDGKLVHRRPELPAFQFAKDVEFLDAGSIRLIFAASVVSVACAVLWLYASTYKLLTQLLQQIKATKRYGDEDVWDYTFNSGRPDVEYVHVRDFDKKITYAGWVEAFSESEKQRELRLRDVLVYDFEGKVLFETPRVYLARKADNIDIEFPYREPEGSTA